MSRTIKLLISFDGTRYEGWQSQKKDKTLQELFEKLLSRILKEPTSVTGSSRTDSGVHALGFVAHFKTKSRIPDTALKKALNFYLPKDVVVHSAKTVPDSFHARFGAKSKLYRYDIWNDATRPVFEAPYVLFYPNKLNLKAMKKAASYLKGTHDFRGFCTLEDKEKNTVRRLKKVTIEKKKSLIRISIEGDGFLRYMVRTIVGTLIEIGRGKMPPDQVKEVLNTGNRKCAGPTAKALGLTLVKVTYTSTSSSRKRGSA